VVLDEEEELFLGSEIVVEPGQADLGLGRDVPDAGLMVSLPGEDGGGAPENPP